MAKTSINKSTPYMDPNKIQLKLRVDQQNKWICNSDVRFK
jgi:hypothetical protein